MKEAMTLQANLVKPAHAGWIGTNGNTGRRTGRLGIGALSFCRTNRLRFSDKGNLTSAKTENWRQAAARLKLERSLC